MRLLKNDDDLFRDSTMTFGEHLDELRVCLWKAIVGIVICFILGLLLGDRVVAFIQNPLEQAMIEYYEDQAAATVKAHVDELVAMHYPKDIADQVEERGFSPEIVYVSPAEMREQLGVDLPATLPQPKEGNGGGEGQTFRPLYLWRPIANDPRVRTTSLSVTEPFTIYVKAALLVGVVLASPWVFYQIWNFVAVGLYRHERKYVHIFLPISLGLFLAGASLAFFFVFKPILQFLLAINGWLDIDPQPRISEWLSFVLLMPLGFGVAFQLPLVMLFLERIGVFDVHAYLSKWRVAVLVIFVIAMVLTPSPDPWSMLMMALPLTGLYFGGVLFCKLMPRRKSPYEE